jgi:hypothetical protein
LSQANLTDATLEGITLLGAVLADACMDGVDLTGIDLTGVDLSGVDPTALGLTEEQLEQVAAVGVTVDPDTPISVRGAQGAWAGDVGILFWENQDGEEARTLRFSVSNKKKMHDGILPVPAEMAVARAVSANEDGFSIAVLRDRPGGVALAHYRIDLTGKVVASQSANLGYEPMVWPVFGRGPKGQELLYGIARRGPTLVVHGPDADGALATVNSSRVPTARGFIGRHHPVLACKGDVVMSAGPSGAGAPKRTPDGFPGRKGSAVPSGDRLLCVWMIDRVGSRAGGVRYAWLERRGNPETEVLSTQDAVVSLDVVGDADGAWVVWVELTDAGGIAMRCRLPGGAIEPLAPQVDASAVVLAEAVDGPPGTVVTSADGKAYLVDHKGAVRGL